MNFNPTGHTFHSAGVRNADISAKFQRIQEPPSSRVTSSGSSNTTEPSAFPNIEDRVTFSDALTNPEKSNSPGLMPNSLNGWSKSKAPTTEVGSTPRTAGNGRASARVSEGPAGQKASSGPSKAGSSPSKSYASKGNDKSK